MEPRLTDCILQRTLQDTWSLVSQTALGSDTFGIVSTASLGMSCDIYELFVHCTVVEGYSDE